MSPAEILREGQKALFAQPPDLEKAKQSFERVTGLAPEWVEGHHWLAAALEQLGKSGTAVTAYKRAIRCDTSDPRPRIALGRLLVSMGHVREGATELQHGIDLKPHYGEADARLFLAEAFEKAKNFRKAAKQRKIVAATAACHPSCDKPRRETLRKANKTKSTNHRPDK